MFIVGNGTERMYVSTLKLKDEVVVDMFCGIGYFSLPLAKHNQLKALICIEKNETSFHYLRENVRSNKLENTGIVTILGDNRECGNDWVGKADRVFMGYLPTPVAFLPRAFAFLKPTGGIIHYHHTCSKQEFETLALLHMEQVKSANFSLSNLCFHLLDFRVVKSYAPHIFHCVADILIQPE